MEVTRSYCGQLGKWANCQTVVFATYLGRGGTALVNRRRHQSRDWVSRNSHAGRQRRTEVQADTPFRTKPQLVLKMLAGLVAEGSLKVRLVTCDEGFSCSYSFFDGVTDQGNRIQN